MKLIVPRFLMILCTTTLLSCSAPKSLEYKDFKNFSVEKLGFTTSRVKMDLIYNNPNNFGLQLRRTDLDIFINNNFLGHSSSDTLINIPRRNDFTLPIKFDADMKNILKNIWNTILGNEVTLKMTGTLKVGKANVFMSVPVNYEGKQKFGFFDND